jgi:hypothetical protein
VAHTCKPSYSGGIDQEDHSLKPTQAKSPLRPYPEKTLHKKELVEWLKVQALSSSTSTTKRKKKFENDEDNKAHQASIIQLGPCPSLKNTYTNID